VSEREPQRSRHVHAMLGFGCASPNIMRRRVTIVMEVLTSPSPRRTPGPSVFALRHPKKSLGPGFRRDDGSEGTRAFMATDHFVSRTPG